MRNSHIVLISSMVSYNRTLEEGVDLSCIMEAVSVVNGQSFMFGFDLDLVVCFSYLPFDY